MTDATAGITDLDNQVAKLLRKINESILIANKVDNKSTLFTSPGKCGAWD